MSHVPEKRKRKMDALISGDNSKAHGSGAASPGVPAGPQEPGGGPQAKSACMAAQGTASGDTQSPLGHDYVTVLCDLEDESQPSVLHTHQCDLDDVWQHKVPLPLGRFPPKAIKTGNKYYDAIIPDLPRVGYRPLQLLSKGRSGAVLLVQDARPGAALRDAECTPLALKLHSGRKRKAAPHGQAGSQDAATERTEEMLIHQRLQHHNVVQMLAALNFQGRLGIVMEFCESGNLESLLRAHDARFVNEAVARRYLQQIHSGVEYLHLMGVAHRDLCPANVLVTFDNCLKLCDLSSAITWVPGDPMPGDVAGTPGYQAPEMLVNQGGEDSAAYDPRRADLWSLGCLLYQMVVGRLPHGRLRTADEARALRPLAFPAPNIMVLTPQVKELLGGVLAYVASSRYTLNRVRNHDWFSQPDDGQVQIGSFYLVRQPQKISDGERERQIKAEFEI